MRLIFTVSLGGFFLGGGDLLSHDGCHFVPIGHVLLKFFIITECMV